jgi:hypothetical protein
MIFDIIRKDDHREILYGFMGNEELGRYDRMTGTISLNLTAHNKRIGYCLKQLDATFNHELLHKMLDMEDEAKEEVLAEHGTNIMKRAYRGRDIL